MEAFSVSGIIASIAGLAISIWLIFITKGAKKAAQEAKLLISSKNLVVELRDLLGIMEQALMESDHGGRRSIKILLTRCSHKINYFKTRWKQEFKGRKNIAYISNDLDKLINKLSESDCESLEKEEKYLSDEGISKILKYLNAELGYFDAKDLKEN